MNSRRRRAKFLDHEGAELVLIGASDDVTAELGIELDPRDETGSRAKILRDLRLRKSEHPIEPLLSGEWTQYATLDPMGFTVIEPTAPLAGLVALLWDCEFPLEAQRFERILPKPRPSLLINLLEDETRVYEDDAGEHCQRGPGSVLSGPYTRSFVIDTTEQARVMGVEFQAGGSYPLFGERVDLLAGREVGLEELLGARARGLREQLLHTPCPRLRLNVLERWLVAQLRSVEVDPLVRHAIATLTRAPAQVRIAALARDSGTSLRRFGAVFREQVGLSPKRFARALRFRAVIDSVHRHERVDWAAVAVDCGFHDQPHLVREFRDFAGMTPTAYLARQGQHANHVLVE